MAFYGKQPSYYSSPSMEDTSDGQWMDVEDSSRHVPFGDLLENEKIVHSDFFNDFGDLFDDDVDKQ